MKWKIGNIKVNNQIVLAPMAGVSNPAYMKICEENGVGYAVTELISSEAIVRGNKKTLEMLNGINNLHIPIAVQIFGSNINSMVEASKILTNLYQNVLIDINMGCPVPKVAVRAQAGSALLKNPEKVRKIVQEVVKAVPVPVTVKIRSGWDEKSINAVEIAKIVEEAGASAITVHPRTRAQGYSGKANWNVIKQVKEAVSIPVIGNGDIKSCYDAKRMIEETGCDAVMIGRGVLGNPWLIRECVDYLENEIVPKKITVEEKINMVKHHIELLKKTKCDKLALLEIRSHATWYLKGINNSSNLRSEICHATSIDSLIQMLDTFLEEKKYEC